MDENTPQSTRYRSNQPVVTLDLKNLGPVHDTSSYNMGSPPPLPKTTVKAPIRDFEFSLAIEDTPKPDHAQEPITPLSPDRENENPWAIDPVPPKNFEPPIEEIKTHGSKPHGGPFFEDVFSTPDKQDTKVHHSQAGQAQLIQTLVDDALLRALDRAIPARIDRKIDLEWDKFIQDAVTKLGPHVENAMEQKIKEWTQKEFKMILKEAVLHELKIILDKISA